MRLTSNDNVNLSKRLGRELSNYRSDIERLSEEIVALERKLSKFDAGRVNIEPQKMENHPIRKEQRAAI